MGSVYFKDKYGIFHRYINGGGMEMDLLWTNSSPTSSFAAQTITVPNANKYKFLCILVKVDAGNNGGVYTPLIPVIGQSVTSAVLWINQPYNYGQRHISYDGDDEITFENYVANSGVSNDVNVPLKIYGIK